MKYFTYNPIAEAGLKKLPAGYEKTENAEEADAALVRSFSLLDTEFSPNLKAIARAGAGVNNIPVDRCAESGIVVFNTPGANSNGVKELTLLGLLLASRDAKGGMAWVEENRADENIAKTMEKAKKAYAGTEIAGKTLGIIGLGAIGAKLANACIALGMDVIGYDPFLSVKGALFLDPRVQVVTELSDLYKAADYVSIHVPENPATKGTLCKAAFDEMKDGVAVLNFARPGLVVEDDLKAALESGKVRKYVTDVPTYAVANLSNVIAFPHLGASTEEAETMCAIMAAEELTEFLENGNIVNSVNFPAVSLGAKQGPRVLVLLKGDKLQEVTALINRSAAIVKSASAEKKGFAAALFETAEAVPAAALKELETIEGVLKIYAI